MSTNQVNASRRTFVKLSAASMAALMLQGSGFALADESMAQELKFTPGTYSALAEGKNEPFEVEVTFSEDAITEISIPGHAETRYISDMALEKIPSQIVEYQSLNIDSVTGATITSNAIMTAVRDCVEQAGGATEVLEEAQGPEQSTETVELDADLVVIGAGASGMAAAVASALNGAKSVIVFEKTSNMGGNCMVSGGFFVYPAAPDELRPEMTDGLRNHFERVLENAAELGISPDAIAAVQQDYDDYYAAGNTRVYDSLDFYAIDQAILSQHLDLEVMRKQGEIAHNYAEWLTELGFNWRACMPIAGFQWPNWSACADTPLGTGEGFFDIERKVIEENNLPVTLLPLTPANELIVEDGRVVGAKGVSDDGTTYVVHASTGVILASGGYAGNADMIKELDTYWGFEEDDIIPTTNAYGHTGDGIHMATTAGAALEGCELTMMLPYADLKDFSSKTAIGDAGNILIVNSEGRRYVDETADRYTLTKAMMQQTNQIGWTVVAGNTCLFEGDRTSQGVRIDTLIERGQLFKGETIAELAEACGMDPAVLEETVATYNAYAEAGVDKEFGRVSFNENSPLLEPPYYASPRTWAAHITEGGLIVDEDYRVLDTKGTPIEGLYAIGEVVNQQAGIGVMGDGLNLAKKLFTA